MDKAVILYFTDGPIATSDDIAEIASLNADIRYRNAEHVNEFERPEPCDGVAGHVPVAYKDLPKAQAAIADFEARRAAEFKEMKDSAGQSGLEVIAPKTPKGKGVTKTAAESKVDQKIATTNSNGDVPEEDKPNADTLADAPKTVPQWTDNN